ncbi:hypothetical protein [Streptomyces mirabilis]|uniref:hypothetical protein n=1 Tax=Streptomyces mirabilis TaxID=68239 RepID=UPI0021C03A20|nr:hypothetical protein [Streptomyces mirabilis]MCT9113579.1 hypothetical protein [Streptomyces mirabilis]
MTVLRTMADGGVISAQTHRLTITELASSDDSAVLRVSGELDQTAPGEEDQNLPASAGGASQYARRGQQLLSFSGCLRVVTLASRFRDCGCPMLDQISEERI